MWLRLLAPQRVICHKTDCDKDLLPVNAGPTLARNSSHPAEPTSGSTGTLRKQRPGLNTLEELRMKKVVAGFSLAALMMSGAMAFASGADDYKAKCAMCHGADGRGAMAKKMGSGDLAGTSLSEADIAKIVADGKGKMTGFKGKLSDDQIKAVAAYVKTLK